MSRRIEITVPNIWAEPVRDCLQNKEKCNLSQSLEKPNMVVEMTGLENTIFFVTVSGPAVSGVLEQLRKNGFGVSIGRIILTGIDYVKPDLSKPLVKIEHTNESATNSNAAEAKPKQLKGFQHFQKARKTTEELYNEISNQTNMTINTWANLIGASIMAAGGLTTFATVFIVAAMLVSPIMGPILGMTFGYRIADWPLFRTGFVNEFKMASVAFLTGAFFGLVLGDVGKTYKWPNAAMMNEGQAFNLIISIVVSAAAGTVLGVSLTSTGGNALVGTAISAGLLPPIVNAGMMISYSFTYAPKEKQVLFYSTGFYSLTFYATHVITIICVANFVFWLKDIDPRFREGDESDFSDIPSLVEHKRRLEQLGIQGSINGEKAKAEFFFKHIREDVTDLAFNIKDKATDFASIVTGGMISQSQPNRRKREDSSEEFDVESQPSARSIRPFKVSTNQMPTSSTDGSSSQSEINTAKQSGVKPEYARVHRQDDEVEVDISDFEDLQSTSINNSNSYSQPLPLGSQQVYLNRHGTVAGTALPGYEPVLNPVLQPQSTDTHSTLL